MADLNSEIQEFGQNVIGETLDIIRDQRDQSGGVDLAGDIQVSPQQFLSGKTVIYGPVSFETAFQGAPRAFFDQQPAKLGQLPNVQASGQNYTPFLVKPFVHDWKINNGAVDGFFIGLYAITPVPEGITTHTIFWRVQGTASPYKDPNTTEAWTEAYNHNEADFLVDDNT